MTVWTRDQLKEIAVVGFVMALIGFLLGRRRYQNRMPRTW